MTTADSKTNDSLTAILFAVFAVACIGAFLAYRGSDVGQLPKLIGNLGGGALVGGGVSTSILSICFAGTILGAWVGVGHIVLSLLQLPKSQNHSHVLDLASKAAIGAAAWSLVWFVLGLFGLYSSIVALIAVILGLIAFEFAFRRARKAKEEIPGSEKSSAFDKFLLLLIGLSIVLSFIAALAPATAKDTLLYHFALPKAFVAQHSNAIVDGNIASYLSLSTEMQIVWARLIGDVNEPMAEAVGSVTVWFFFPLLLLAVYGWATELGVSRIVALIAALTVATIPTAYYVASSGYIDLSLALYVTLATHSLTRWWKEPTWGWVALMAIFLGAALAIKLTAVVVFAAFALIILVRARGAQNAGKIVGLGFASLMLAGLIASPWYLRTWAATGSPVFPFYMSIWPGMANGWDVERSNLFQSMNSQYGGVDENKLNIVTAPVRASIAAQPEQAEYYDGVLGVAFLIGLPILVWALWKFDLPVEVKIAAGVAGILYLFWLFSSEQLRYLLPIIPLLAIAIAASAEAITKTRARLGSVLRCSLIAACVCGLLTTAAWFLQKAPLRVVLGGETRDQYLARNLDYYPYYQSINTETPADSKVWLINMRRDTYNIERPVFSDYLFEDWTLRKMVWDSRSLQELRSKAAAMNVQYVLARHDFLFDYDHSTLVDDRAPRAENEAKLKMAKDFILDPERTVKADNKFSLTKVF